MNYSHVIGIKIRKLLNFFFSLCFSRFFFFLCPARCKSWFIKFYSKYCLTGRGTIIHHRLVNLIFVNLIDYEIKTNKKSIDYYQRLIFKDVAALEWSTSKNLSKKIMFDYYMKDGKNSCLPEIVEYINNFNGVKKNKKFKILDIGCGTGNCIEILQDLIGPNLDQITGIDWSESAINNAINRFRNSRHKFFCSDIINF
jgi:hypothetical protein